VDWLYLIGEAMTQLRRFGYSAICRGYIEKPNGEYYFAADLDPLLTECRTMLENVLEAWVNGRKVRDGIPLEVLTKAQALLADLLSSEP
jgi:hypothetical protein